MAASAAPDRQWYIVSRWQEYDGEMRANLLRVAGIACFYAAELLIYYWLGAVERPFHLAVTALAVAWTMTALGVHYCLRVGIFPRWLKFVSTGCDVLFLTCALTLGSGAASPLLVGYFVLIMLSGLRFSLVLVWFASGACLAGYVFLLGYTKWFLGQPERNPARHYQVLFVLGLVFCGVVLGQIIRRVRSLAEDYARRLEEADKKTLESA